MSYNTYINAYTRLWTRGLIVFPNDGVYILKHESLSNNMWSKTFQTPSGKISCGNHLRQFSASWAMCLNIAWSWREHVADLREWQQVIWENRLLFESCGSQKNNKYQMYKKSTNSQPKHHLVLSAMAVETTHFSPGGLDFFPIAVGNRLDQHGLKPHIFSNYSWVSPKLFNGSGCTTTIYIQKYFCIYIYIHIYTIYVFGPKKSNITDTQIGMNEIINFPAIDVVSNLSSFTFCSACAMVVREKFHVLSTPWILRRCSRLPSSSTLFFLSFRPLG